MKLHGSLLQRLIELPSNDAVEQRKLLDDLGLEVKDYSDGVFTIETLANRGDHLSAFGVARELSARLLTGVKMPALAAELPEKRTSVPVTVDSDLCLRYGLLELHLPSELALGQEVAGVLRNPDPERHAIVHLLNYILLEIGQPMHAFDAELIQGEVRVKVSDTPTEVHALDDRRYIVPAGSLLICDARGPVAVAGVIGLANSMVTSRTKKVLIESATFDPVSVRKTARAMGLSTDASYAFERGADIDLVATSLKRLLYLCTSRGAEAARATGYTLVDRAPVEPREVPLSLVRLRKEVNLPRLSEGEVTARLKHLGYTLAGAGTPESWKVTVPTWRLWDVRNEDDLVEDFARSHGLGQVKIELPPLDPQPPAEHPNDALRSKIEPVLHGNGFVEVITKAYYSRDDVGILAERDRQIEARHIAIKNSLESSYSHLKVTNVLHFLRLAEQNHRQGVSSCKIYEFGRTFRAAKDGNAEYEFEDDKLFIAASGRWYAGDWRGEEQLEQSLRLFRGVVLECISRVCGSVRLIGAADPLLHPGAQAELVIAGGRLGVIGVVHPDIQAATEAKHPLFYAELDVAALKRETGAQSYSFPSDHPVVRRDITLRVGVRQYASEVLEAVHSAQPANLARAEIVDDFRKCDEQFRRVSFRLTFQADDRTLQSAEVDSAMAQLLKALAAKGFELSV